MKNLFKKFKRVNVEERGQAKSDYSEKLQQLKKEFIEKFEKSPPSSSEGLENFETIKTLGIGSFGRVFLVKHIKANTYHAMKVMSKRWIITTKQVHHITTEKKILASMNFPFVINMDYSFKDNTYIYFLMPFMCGGDLYNHLKKSQKFSEDLAKFYASQIVLALEYLHFCNIIYRDLKPENILISETGYIKIADLGFCKIISGRTYSLCGTPEYLAPEIILSKGYGKSVDWWSFGIIIYEMCAGATPFLGKNHIVIYEKITKGKFKKPIYFSSDLIDLTSHLLQVDLSHRYGNLVNGVMDIKNHRWFSSVNFNDIFERTVVAPSKPTVKFAGDSSNFENIQEIELTRTHQLFYEAEFENV